MKPVHLSAAGALVLAVGGFLEFLIEAIWAFERGWWVLGLPLLGLAGLFAVVGVLAALGLFADWLFSRRKA